MAGCVAASAARGAQLIRHAHRLVALSSLLLAASAGFAVCDLITRCIAVVCPSSHLQSARARETRGGAGSAHGARRSATPTARGGKRARRGTRAGGAHS